MRILTASRGDVVWFRLTFFAVFVLFAAPFEQWLDFLGGTALAKQELQFRPLFEATIDAYVIVLCAENAFRLIQHSELVSISRNLKVAAVGTVVSFIVAFGHYMPNVWPRVVFLHPPRPATAWYDIMLELFALAVALTSSILAYSTCENGAEVRLRSPKVARQA